MTSSCASTRQGGRGRRTLRGLTPSAASEPQTNGTGHERAYHLRGNRCAQGELQVALLAPGAIEPVIWTVRNEARMADRLRRKPERVAPGPIASCYEAGPCVYALQRQLDQARSAVT